MRRFGQHYRQEIREDLSNLKFTGNEKKFALDLLSDIDDQIGSINSEIEYDTRPKKQTGKRLAISQLIDDKDREKFTALANKIIDDHPELSRGQVPGARKEKDYAIQYNELDKTIYVNVRPTGKRSAAGDDPNELMTAALCVFPKQHKITNSDEMDALIELVRGQLKKVKGYKQGQVDALKGDYPNLCQAVSAANAIISAGYGGADMVYLTGQAWDDDVKQFQRTKYGMTDFNSSDFIIRKGKKYLGVSLKKKPRITTGDPTLINKAFSSLLNGSPELKKVREGIEKDAGNFYVHVIKLAARLKVLSPELMKDLKKERPNNKNWKQYVQRIPNDLVNRVLKGKRTLFKVMGKTIMDNGDLIANQLVQLIFKADLKELKQFDFDFTLVTGIGDYGPSKGVVVEKGEYKDIDSVTSQLDDLFTQGKPKMIFTPGAKQAFEPGATAANLKFDLMIGKVTVCNIILRYKGDFRSAPNFNATMTNEFKKLYKG
tara:strand:- start:8687 stop:10150 length:1464 start_codon:yes stop_codon:yes gene_type:complete